MLTSDSRLAQGPEHDHAIVSIAVIKVREEPEAAEAAEGEAAEAPAAEASGDGAQANAVASAAGGERTEVVMPKMGGIEVLRRAKRIRPSCEVVLMTAFAFAEKKVKKVVEQARNAVVAELGAEHQRLRALARVNPNVRDDELQALVDRQARVIELLDRTQVRLDALLAQLLVRGAHQGRAEAAFACRDGANAICDADIVQVREDQEFQ